MRLYIYIYIYILFFSFFTISQCFQINYTTSTHILILLFSDIIFIIIYNNSQPRRQLILDFFLTSVSGPPPSNRLARLTSREEMTASRETFVFDGRLATAHSAHSTFKFGRRSLSRPSRHFLFFVSNSCSSERRTRRFQFCRYYTL